MKLTWFGGTALRIYVGGQIVVIDPETANDATRQQELLSGADIIARLGENRPLVDAVRWQPPRPSRAIDGPREPDVLSIAPETCLITGDGDPPLLVSNATELPRLGRWADTAVLLLFGPRGASVAESIFALDLARPRHLVLAADTETVERLVERLFSIDDRAASGWALSSLEPGLAVEV